MLILARTSPQSFRSFSLNAAATLEASPWSARPTISKRPGLYVDNATIPVAENVREFHHLLKSLLLWEIGMTADAAKSEDEHVSNASQHEKGQL